MSTERQYIDHLNDILDALLKSVEFVDGLTFEQFYADDKTAFAVVRALEIIGEATKQLPDSLRDGHPKVPWRDMAGMRDKLAHHYFGVNLLVVWKTVMEDVPALIPMIRSILENAEFGQTCE